MDTDPLSRGRIMLHMRRGIAAPSDVLADANSQLAARGRAMAEAAE